MNLGTKTALASAAGLAAAAASALCCAGPLLAVVLGMGSAAFAATLEPLRPFFVAGTVLALGAGFVLLRREDRLACDPGTPCAAPAVRRRMRRALWTATALAIPLLTFPWWSGALVR